MFIFFPFYLFIFPSPAKMDLGEDLGPDKKYLNRSIQTEDDSIFEYAEDIVNNFNRIKRNLEFLERTFPRDPSATSARSSASSNSCCTLRYLARFMAAISSASSTWRL